MKKPGWKVALLVVAVLWVGAGAALAAEKVAVLCDDGYPPYSFGENGVPKGVYVDILKEAFAKMPDYEVEIKPVPWKRLLAQVENGDAFAGFPPYASKNRPWMTLSEPILEEKLVVFGPKSKFEGKTKWPDDFSGARVGINAGFDHSTVLGEAGAAAVKEGKIKIDEGPDSETNLKKIGLGRIDFYVNDQLTNISSVATGDDPVIIGAEVGGQWGHLGFTQKLAAYPFAQDFMDKFNAAIKELKDSGRIAEIVKGYQK